MAGATAHTTPTTTLTTITTRLLCYDVACACVRLLCVSPLSLSSSLFISASRSLRSLLCIHSAHHSQEASKVTVSCALYVVKETKNILCAYVREYETSLSKATCIQRKKYASIDDDDDEILLFFLIRLMIAKNTRKDEFYLSLLTKDILLFA